jgi:signal transduction histidine kinase
METAGARRRGAVSMTALRALRSARGWRATLHALAGLPVGLGGGAVIVSLLVVWLAAVASLLGGAGDWQHVALYLLAVLVIPVLLPRWVQAVGALQQARFGRTLGVEIPLSPATAGRWPLRLIGPWGAAGIWRQLAYHFLALTLGVVGGVVVASCWSAVVLGCGYLAAGGRWPGPAAGIGLTGLALALLLAAPWVARAVARVDEAAARALLGPSRADGLARRVESLSRSRAEVIAATDAERRRIERDLHDGAQQRLVSLAMNLGMARATFTDPSDPARQVIEAAHEEAIEALAELREFVRGLHPAVLNDRGLDAALSGIAARAPLPVRLHVDVPRRCSPSVEAVAYFVVSEALTNVAKHAAASRAWIAVDRVGDRLRVVVTDDGRGGATLDGGPPDRAGSGLRGLAQRAAAVDGTLAVHSPPGGPTMITAELPCES